MNNEISTHEALSESELVLRLSSTRCGARLARHLAVRQLHVWGVPYDSSASDNVAAVVAELAANAVTHGRVPGRDFELRVCLVPGAVRVAVSDTRTERRPPEPGELAAPEAEADGGRGLLLVQELSRAWGVLPRVPGKTVWAEIARTPFAEVVTGAR